MPLQLDRIPPSPRSIGAISDVPLISGVAGSLKLGGNLRFIDNYPKNLTLFFLNIDTGYFQN